MVPLPSANSNVVNDFLRQEYTEVSSEIHQHILKNATWASRAFQNDTIATELIKQFLWDNPLYDNAAKRWKCLPQLARHEGVLIEPLSNIIASIISYFGDPATRTVHHVPLVDGLKLYNAQRARDTGEMDELSLLPNISILGHSSSFSPASHLLQHEELDLSIYANCVTPLLVKPSKYLHPHDIAQMAIYARQCFRLQENRFFVFSLLLTEESVHLFLFDRSGCYHSSPINIHSEADDFIRLILGVSSKVDGRVGIDPGIMWNEDKTERFFKIVDEQNVELARFTLVKNHPYSQHEGILGNGTSCWLAYDSESKKYVIIKDTWNTVYNRLPEAQFLCFVEGMKGVSQMKTFITGPTTAMIRGLPSENVHALIPHEKFMDRQYSRMIIYYDGKPLSSFATREEVLVAMWGAIAAHQRLWNVGILHRDICMDNIVIGPANSDDDQRVNSTLIDLSEAIWLEHDTIPEVARYNTGTSAFQSTVVLRSVVDTHQNTTHDYFDDLESFFYVLCCITIGHEQLTDQRSLEGQWKKRHPYPPILDSWTTAPISAAASKEEVLFNDKTWFTLTCEVLSSFGPGFVTLLNRYRTFLQPTVKEAILRSELGPPS